MQTLNNSALDQITALADHFEHEGKSEAPIRIWQLRILIKMAQAYLNTTKKE